MGNNVRIFVGDNTGIEPVGLELTSGTAVLIKENDLEAGFVTGTVRLLGVDGVTLQATMTLRLNEFSTAINETYILDGETITVAFDADQTVDFVEVTGGNILIGLNDVATLSGNFGFQYNGSDVVAVGSNVTILLNAGDSSVGITGADIGLITGANGTVVESKNGAFAATISGVGSLGADSALFRYSDSTGTVIAGTELAVGNLSYIFDSAIAPNTVVISATNASASVDGFVSLSGNLGFTKVGNDIVATGNNVSASLSAGTASVALNNAGFGLQTGAGGTLFELSGNGDAFVATIDGLSTIGAASVLVRYTDATASVAANTTLSAGLVDYIFAEDIAPNTIAFAVTALHP